MNEEIAAHDKLLEAALSGEGDFAALDLRDPVSGAQALAALLRAQ